MALADDLRKTLTDPTPLYFAAGTADLVVEQVKKAPERLEAVRKTDPRAAQAQAAERAREAQEAVQTKVNELFGSIDRDPRKLGETAQGIALRGVGVALEYAVKARETYVRVAERGEHSVRSWRGEAAEDINDIAVAVEPETPAATRPERTERPTAPRTPVATDPAEAADASAPKAATPRKATPRKATPRKAAPRKAPGARKTPPPTEDK